MCGITSVRGKTATMFPCATEEDKTIQLHHQTALIPVAFEPVGRWFEAYINYQSHGPCMSFKSDGSIGEDGNDDDDQGELSGQEVQFMISLDPKEWKKQDHYKVLGVTQKRYDATEEEIRKAYRHKVLKFHPDKRTSNDFIPPGLNEHDYFTCLTKAYEVLSNANTRRAYDSIDPLFDDSIPSVNANNKDNFFEVFREKFLANARWSVKQPVPDIGNVETSMEETTLFYEFWYNFDSWREFSYLDEEDKDKAESREERRWMEKMNRQIRQKRKKEELVRIRSLVDNAYACDPRIKKYKELEKSKKQEEKRLKEEAQRERDRQRKEAEEMERKQKEMEEQEFRERAAKEKKEREKVKKVLNRERRSIRQHMKDNGYFQTAPDLLAKEMEKTEVLLMNLSLDKLQELREATEGNSALPFKQLYDKRMTEVEEDARKAEEEKQEKMKANKTHGLAEANRPWTTDEIQLLVKGTTLFPVGTASRWQVIANYINEHAAECQNRTAKQVINQVKNLQKPDSSVKDEVNKKAFEKLEKTIASKNVKPESDPTLRDQGATEAAEKPWSSEEQRLLEQALKTYPANTPERWDRIAESVPTRTKKDCMRRYKELVEMVKAKKVAQSSVAKKK